MTLSVAATLVSSATFSTLIRNRDIYYCAALTGTLCSDSVLICRTYKRRHACGPLTDTA